MSFTLRWWRIKWYRILYRQWCIARDPCSYYAQQCIQTANALWDKMSLLDRRFIQLTETQ